MAQLRSLTLRLTDAALIARLVAHCAGCGDALEDVVADAIVLFLDEPEPLAEAEGFVGVEGYEPVERAVSESAVERSAEVLP